MIDCKYNYGLKDNLLATKYLIKEQKKRKTNLVSLLVVIMSAIGFYFGLNSVLSGQKNWSLLVFSVLLLVGYFLVDVVFVQIELKKQEKYFKNSMLKDVTKILIRIDETKIEEIFFKDSVVIGKNVYQKSDITAFAIKDKNYFFVFNNENVVMLKKNVLTAKQILSLGRLMKNLKEKNKKISKKH